MVEYSSGISFRRASTLTLGGNNLLLLVEALWDPLITLAALWILAIYAEGTLTPPYLILSVIVFAMTFPGTRGLRMPAGKLVRSILVDWMIIASLLLFFGYASEYIDLFDKNIVLTWLAVTPAVQLAAHLTLRRFAPSVLEAQGKPQRAIIAGANDHGLALVNEIARNPYIATQVVGYFDDRRDKRVLLPHEFSLLGGLSDVPQYAKKNHIDAIYITLPMASQPRILQLLNSLSDTTVSIYFVPDIFITDLMQGRMDAVGEIPVVAVCETPFTGMNALMKRASDLVLATLILILIFPVLLAIAIAVKTTSPGPVIFRQRRYGLNGEEIVVSKFRSMTVCEDGGTIKQALKNDARVTRVGAILRKTSLDELPQFFNVLQGCMSIVGPRPHAVAHNELYRKIIKGYMVRHKVRPGITGWAQVNGCRGETDTVEKMKKRIDYDLAYLRNWSLWLDSYIIFKTVAIVLRDRNATDRRKARAAIIACACMAAASVSMADPLPKSPYRMSDGALQDYRVRDDPSYRLTPKPAPKSSVEAQPKPQLSAELADKPFSREIEAAAQDAGIDPALVHALIYVESRHRQQAVSSKGALGLMQVLPDTAARFGVRHAGSLVQANLKAGTMYLRELMETFGDRLDLVLAAYNAGEGAVQRYDFRIPPYPETRKYVRDVMTKYDEWRIPAAPATVADSAPPAAEYLAGTRLTLPSAVVAAQGSPSNEKGRDQF